MLALQCAATDHGHASCMVKTQPGMYQNKYAHMDIYVDKYVCMGQPKSRTKVLRTKTSAPATLMWWERYLGNFVWNGIHYQSGINDPMIADLPQ